MQEREGAMDGSGVALTCSNVLGEAASEREHYDGAA